MPIISFLRIINTSNNGTQRSISKEKASLVLIQLYNRFPKKISIKENYSNLRFLSFLRFIFIKIGDLYLCKITLLFLKCVIIKKNINIKNLFKNKILEI